MQPQLLTVVKEETLRDWNPGQWKQWWIEPKYDGARLIYHKGQFLSRTGKPLHNLQHIADELGDLPGWTFDGEVYGENWSEVMSVARASKSERTTKLKFAVFDVMSDEDWCRQACDETLIERRIRLRALLLGKFMLMQHVHVVSHCQAMDFPAFQHLHRMYLKRGCDGTVLKLAESPYEFKRTKTWLKVKPVETFDCVVYGVEPGEGKHEGRMGKLTIKPEGSEVFCCVGTGFSDAERQDMWDMRFGACSIIGRTIEVAARGVHKSGRLIEPRFIRIREDK